MPLELEGQGFAKAGQGVRAEALGVNALRS